MPKCLWLILGLLLWSSFAPALTLDAELADICHQIVNGITTDEPLILDIRAGEWSQALATEIKKLLLEQGADLREIMPRQHSPAFFDEESDSLDEEESYDLESLNLTKAILLLVEMELQWQTVSKKGFLTYSSQRKPLYVFNIKQIELPSRQLRKLDTISKELNTSHTQNQTLHGIKWYEPMLVTAALASIIYLLWTIE